jgi:hypothetical protein
MLSTKPRQVSTGGTISRYEMFPLLVRIVSLDIAGIVVHTVFIMDETPESKCV